MTFTDEDLHALAMTYILRGYLNSEPHGDTGLARDAYRAASDVGADIIRSHGIDADLFNEDPELRDYLGCRDVDTWVGLLRETIERIEIGADAWRRAFRKVMAHRAATHRSGGDEAWWAQAARETRDLYIAHGGR